MKLVVDMNLSPRWVVFLQAAGIEAVHWSGIGKWDAADHEILAYAGLHSCIVLTHDLDLSAILATTRGNRPSVIQIRSDDVSPEKIGAHVVGALRELQSELAAGALLTIDPLRTRVTLLPLTPRSGQR